MFVNFYKKKNKKYYIKNINSKKKTNEENNIVKFCIFAGRKMNLQILHKYIEVLLQENIIHEYHIFDFSRNILDKNFLYESYKNFTSKYPKQIFLHNYKSELQIFLKTIIFSSLVENYFLKFH